MDYKEYLKYLEDQVVRVEAMRDNFPLFFAFHFGREFKQFHIDRMRSLQSSKNTFIEGFRESRKTTIGKGFIIRCIVYKKYEYIIRGSANANDSVNNVTDVAKMLFKKSIVNDYGQLYSLSAKKEDFEKKTQGNFDTVNQIKIQAKGIMQNTRGLNTFDMNEEMIKRPDLLFLDDIDIDDLVYNSEIIDKTEQKIKGQIFGGLEAKRHKIVFFGNTILEDGVVPRLRRLYKDNTGRDIFSQPLFVNGENVRPEVFTPEIVEKAQSHGKISFGQNYLLIPASSGTGIFVRDYFDYFIESHFENVDSFLKKQDVRRGMFIDPAFSTNAESDDAVVYILGEHRISKQYYLLDGYGNTSAPSITRQNIIMMHNKAKMGGYNIEFVHCEDVKINKDQTQFVDDLRAELIQHQISCPLYTTTPQKQKIQRIKDILEPVFSMKGIKFNRNMDSNVLAKLERQLLNHPNNDHDDHSDCLAQGVGFFRRQGEPKQKTEHVPISSITGEPMRGHQQQRRYKPNQVSLLSRK